MEHKPRWFMLTLVGKDQAGIVSHLTSALYEGQCNLGEASMMRLGGNFTIMLMVSFAGTIKQLRDVVISESESFGLHLHIDQIDAHLHDHLQPDVRISVYGADRAGIVAKVTGVLAEAGLHITDLESDVGGSNEAPIYIMHIEGVANEGLPSLQAALDIIHDDGIETRLTPVEVMLG